MPKEGGSEFQFHIGDGASPELFDNVPAENVNFNGDAPRADASDNDNNGWGAGVATIKNGIVTIAGPFNEDDPQQTLLRAKWIGGLVFNGRVIYGSSGDYLGGAWSCTNFTMGGSISSAKTFSATLSSYNAMTETIA